MTKSLFFILFGWSFCRSLGRPSSWNDSWKKLISVIGTVFLSASLFFFSQNGWAIKTVNEEITISADYMQLNIETGNSVFNGNVEISQGKLTLTGDKVTLKRKRLKNGETEVDKLTITGHPARYSHITNKGKTINAESAKMVYTASIGKLVMTTNARLTQPENQVSSEKIVYDTIKQIVIAGAKKPAPTDTSANGSTTDKAKPNQRVKITLTPKKNRQ